MSARSQRVEPCELRLDWRIDIATLREVGERRAGAGVMIAGRVTAVDAERARLDDGTSACWVEPVELGLGAWALVQGTLDGSVKCERYAVLQEPLGEPLPVRGEWAHFQSDDRGRASTLRQRARAMAAVRAYFARQEFVELETPLAVPSPGLDLHLDALEISNAGSPRWLITSPEYQMKRLLAGGLPRIMQICRCFRRGERGQRHQPEFTMLEWYRAFSGSEDVMRDTERLVDEVAVSVLGSSRIATSRGVLDLSPPWERLTVEGAFERYAHVRMVDVLADETRFFDVLTSEIEPRLGLERPVFLTEWPASMASLARLLPDRPDRADRFEAFVSGMELCNGFGELTDPVEQRRRLERDRQARAARGLPAYPIDERFLAALAEGIPPSGGNALGLDRLMMILFQKADIEDVIAFAERRL